MESGAVPGYYIIAADYIDTGTIVFVEEDFQPLSPSAGGPLMEYALGYALTGEAGVAAALVEPVSQVEVEAAPGGVGSGEGEPAAYAFLVPFGTLFVLFFVIVMSSSYLLQSVAGEKENRTAEVLLVSVQPRQLMLGKVLGLGGVALVQIVVWVAGALLALWRVAGTPDLTGFGITPAFLLWLLAFLVLGYAAYGSILAALATMVPSQREGSQLMVVVVLPLMVPLFLNFMFIEDAGGPLPVALSLFPLTAPVAMTTRLAAGGVPLWQPAVALLGLALTACLFVMVAARVLRAGALLSSEPFSWRRVGQAVRGASGR